MLWLQILLLRPSHFSAYILLPRTYLCQSALDAIWAGKKWISARACADVAPTCVG